MGITWQRVSRDWWTWVCVSELNTMWGKVDCYYTFPIALGQVVNMAVLKKKHSCSIHSWTGHGESPRWPGCGSLPTFHLCPSILIVFQNLENMTCCGTCLTKSPWRKPLIDLLMAESVSNIYFTYLSHFLLLISLVLSDLAPIMILHFIHEETGPEILNNLPGSHS